MYIMLFKNLCQDFKINLLNDNNKSPIQLVLIKYESQTENISNLMAQENILIGKIFYPTVKKNQARIRISLNVNHTQEDIYLLCKIL